MSAAPNKTRRAPARNPRTKKPTRRLSPGRPTKQDIIESNEHLLQVALAEFLGKGFRAASIKGIAEASGISRVAIYRRYGTKEALFSAVCERSVLRLRKDLRAFTSNSRDPEKALEEIATHMYEDFSSPELRDVTRLMVGEANNFPQVAESIYMQADETMRPLVEFFRKLDAEGTLRLDDPQTSAFQFSAIIFGSIRPLVLSPDALAKSRKGWIRNAVKIFLYGCAPSRTAKDGR